MSHFDNNSLYPWPDTPLSRRRALNTWTAWMEEGDYILAFTNAEWKAMRMLPSFESEVA